MKMLLIFSKIVKTKIHFTFLKYLFKNNEAPLLFGTTVESCVKMLIASRVCCELNSEIRPASIILNATLSSSSENKENIITS